MNEKLADDLLHNAKEIAEYLGESERRVYYLADRGLLPVIRVGRRIAARKSELRRYFSAHQSSDVRRHRSHNTD